MTDPLSPSEARADDLHQRAEDYAKVLHACIGSGDENGTEAEAEQIIRDLLAALVQAEQREAKNAAASDLLRDAVPLVAHLKVRAEAAESTVLALRQEIEGWRQAFGIRTSNGWQSAAEAKALWDNKALWDKVWTDTDDGRKSFLDLHALWLKEEMECIEALGRAEAAEARLSTYEATIRQVAQEMRKCGLLVYGESYRQQIAEWADALQAAILPDERK
jgi:hypothetical protein